MRTARITHEAPSLKVVLERDATNSCNRKVVARPARSAPFLFLVALEQDNLLIFLVGGTAIAVRGPAEDTPEGDVFNPFRVGLGHLTLGCESEAELERVAAALEEAGVENTGVKLDETLSKRYVAFKNPDCIAWEFYRV